MEVTLRQRIRTFFRSPIVLTVLLVTGATLWLYNPILRGDVPLATKSIPGYTWGNPDGVVVPSIFRDRIVQAYPYHLFTANEIQHGRFPWWNNLIFAGTTFFANGQAGIYSLLKLPFWWLPPIVSYNMVTVLQSVVAAAGFGLLAQKLRWHPAAGIVMALTFTLSSPFVMRMTVTTMSAVFAVLPFVWWAVLRLHERLNWSRMATLAGLVTIMIFAGHVQLAAFALGLTVVWITLWWSKVLWRRRALLFFLALLLGGGITAIQVVPVQDALSQAYRQPHIVSWSKVLTPSRLFRVSVKDGAGLLTLIDQNIWGNERHYRGAANYLEGNLYIGVFALLAVGLSLYGWRKKEWRVLTAIAVINAGLFIFPGWWDVIGKLAPWITVTPVWRTSFVLAFTLSVLAGLGIRELATRRSSTIVWSFVGLMTVVTLWQWNAILPFSPQSTLFPYDPMLTKARELTRDGSRVWMPNGVLDELMPYDVPVSVGYDSVYAQSYLDLWTANSERIEKKNQLVPINPNDAVLRVTGSNTMITKDSVPDGWSTVMTEGKWTLARRTNENPPIHLVYRLKASSSPADIASVDLATTAVVPRDEFNLNSAATGQVRVMQRSATKLTTVVDTTDTAVLVTNLQHYTGWHLKIDGQKADTATVTVNHAFQGAVVNEGTHTVEMYYQPASFRLGWMISLISVVALVAVGLLLPRLEN